MLKSFLNFFKRIKSDNKENETFESYLDRLKKNRSVLNELIVAYKLDINEPLAPQIEKMLGRSLTSDEKQTLVFSVKATIDSGDTKVEKFEGTPYHYGGRVKHRKKK
jgi:hypothetical protein